MCCASCHLWSCRITCSKRASASSRTPSPPSSPHHSRRSCTSCTRIRKKCKIGAGGRSIQLVKAGSAQSRNERTALSLSQSERKCRSFKVGGLEGSGRATHLHRVLHEPDQRLLGRFAVTRVTGDDRDARPQGQRIAYVIEYVGQDAVEPVHRDDERQAALLEIVHSR